MGGALINRCVQCGHSLGPTVVGSVVYRHVVLHNVPTWRCSNCGESEWSVPHVAQLDDLLSDNVRSVGWNADLEQWIILEEVEASACDCPTRIRRLVAEVQSQIQALEAKTEKEPWEHMALVSLHAQVQILQVAVRHCELAKEG